MAKEWKFEDMSFGGYGKLGNSQLGNSQLGNDLIAVYVNLPLATEFSSPIASTPDDSTISVLKFSKKSQLNK